MSTALEKLLKRNDLPKDAKEVIQDEINALRLNQNTSQFFMENVPIGFLRSTIDGQILKANPALVEMLGYSSFEELAQVNLKDLWVDPQIRSDKVKRALKKGQVILEAKIRTKDQREITIKSHAGTIYNNSDEFAFFESVVENITERKKLEISLKENEEKNRELVESITAGIFYFNNEGKFTYVNSVMESLLGYTREELIGQSIFKFVPEDEHQKIRETIKRREQGDKLSIELRAITKNGEIKWLQTSGSPIIKNDSIVGIRGVALDISERKKAEESLRESEEKYRLLFETIPVGVGYSNREGNIIDFNLAMSEITGYSLEEIKKVNVVDTYVNPNDLLKLRTISNVEGKVKNFETQLKRKDGSSYDALLNCVPVILEGEDVTLCTILDQTSSKEMEKTVRESEEKFQKIFEEGPLGMSLVNYKNEYIDVNPALCEMLGYTRDELLSMTFRDITHPDDLENDLKLSKKLFDEEILNHKIEKRYIKKDGSILNAKLSASVIHDDKGDFLYGVGMIEDYTVQKRIEEERLQLISTLQEKESFLTTVMEATPDYIWMLDKKFRIQYFNHTGSTLTREELIGKPIYTFLPLESQQRGKKHLEQAIKGDSIYKYETEVFSSSFSSNSSSISSRIFENNAVALKSENKVVGLVISSRDITEQRISRLKIRKQSEEIELSNQALRESEARFRQIFEKGPLGITLVKSDLRYIDINQAFLDLLGYSKSELMELTFPDITHPEDVKKDREGIKLLQTGLIPVFNSVKRYLTRNNKVKWASTTVTVVRDEKKNFLYYLAMVEDFTQQKQGEGMLISKRAELERSNKALQQFAYATSHDLQEPLRTITSFLQLLKRKYQDGLDSEAHQFINYAVDGAIHMKQLIDDLLSYSRLEMKEISFKPVPLSQIIGKSINNLKVLIEENEARIICKKLPDIRVDETQLILLFQNLIENAIKFRSKEKPVIEITAKVSEENYIISVKDNGIGIEKQYQGRIFQVFKRLHTRAEYPGTGIGLAICRRIIEQYNGKIWIESELGKGSTFVIEFPID